MPGNWPSIRSIEESFATLILPTGDVINELRHLIDQCDIYRYEPILLTPYLVSFADLFGRKITDDQQLNDFFKQLNETALSDVEFAPKMAFVLASQQLGAHTPHETKVRNAMIETLQNNFVTFQQQQQQEKDTQRFYNSLTLLGEYYNRKKIGYGQRINILGHALLSMLTSELEAETSKACKQQKPQHFIDSAFAKLIAAQMSLNGEVMREDHPKEIKELTLMIRRCLITVPNLGKYTKAFLLLAIDMYHSNLTQDLLTSLYDKYIDQEASEEPEPAAAASTVEAEPVPERKSKKSRSKDRKERKDRKAAKESRESTDATDGSSRSGRSERSAAAESGTEDPTQNPLSSDFDLDKYLAKYCPKVYEKISSEDAEGKSKKSRSKERSKEKKTSTTSRSKKSGHSKEEQSTDKENKRRPSSRNEDSSPTHNRHHRQNGEGEPANSSPPPTSPASKKTSSPQTTRTVTISERSPTREGARTDKLAQLPKITITTTTVGTSSPTEKQPVDSGPTSPRGVLVASAKQPKSPTRDRGSRARRTIQQEELPTKAKARSSQKSDSRKVDRHRRAIETEPSSGGGKNVLKQHGNSTNTTGASKHKTGRDTDTKKDRGGSRRKSDVSAKAHGGVVAPPPSPPHGSDAEQEDSSPNVGRQEHCEPESTEKVSWYDLMMEDESPQKPRTESHQPACLTSGE